MSQLRINLILVSAFILLLQGVYGLDFSMGTSNGMNGASESLRLNAGLNDAFAGQTVASPEYYTTYSEAAGIGGLDFDKSFASLDGGEMVRLIAKMTDSVSYNHKSAIEVQTGDRIRASELLTVNQGMNILCSAEAKNSLGHSAKVQLNIPKGSLTDYTNYGDARDDSVTAHQTAIVPKRTRFSIFTEAKRGYSSQSSGSTLLSLKALKADTTTFVNATTSISKSILRPA